MFDKLRRDDVTPAGHGSEEIVSRAGGSTYSHARSQQRPLRVLHTVYAVDEATLVLEGARHSLTVERPDELAAGANGADVGFSGLPVTDA